MVSAPQRRDGVRFPIKDRKISQRRGCALLRIGWSSWRYLFHPRDDGPLGQLLREISRKYLRYGYRRAWAFLVRRGEQVINVN